MSTWTIDPTHSSVTFAVKYMMISTVRGTFADVDGAIEFDEPHPERSSVVARIGAASINTGAAQRDAHLRSVDFFDVERYPSMTFRSTTIEPRGDGWAIGGELTIRDVTRPVVLDALAHGVVPGMQGGRRAGFSALTRIDRADFGLTWNLALEAGGWLVGDAITIELEVAAVEAASVAATPEPVAAQGPSPG
jgi:polyisoprenoid-binding protein YceI